MKNLKQIIHESLLETLKTQRVDMPKINPHQVDIDVWGEIKDKDDEFNKKYNLKKKDKVDTTKMYRSPIQGVPQGEINVLQNNLTDYVKQKAKEQIGTDFIPTDQIEVSDGVKKDLGDKGLELEVKGKVFAYGNTKLPPSTMIINMTSAFNCPSVKCPLRQKICYARNGERLKKNLQIRNLRNQYTSKFLGLKSILQLIEKYIEAAPCRIKNIRLSEDGDFESQNQIDVMDKIAAHLYKKYGISTTCYTHRSDLNFNNCKSMIVNMSDPKSFQGDRFYLAVTPKEFNKLEYGGINRDEKGELYFKCHCDCMRCNFCYNSKEENGEPENEMVKVKCKIHK